MPKPLAGILSLLGRIFLCIIFFMAAVATKIPNFSMIVEKMEEKGVPAPEFMLVCAIVFLLAGTLSIVLGYKARVGGLLLFIFLVLVTYYFHDFWTLEEPDRGKQLGQFMKNLALMGAMLLIMANGVGAWSLDACGCRKKEAAETEESTV